MPQHSRLPLVLALLVLLIPSGCADEPYDLILRGGFVLDGTGNEAFAADVGIRGERIAAVGNLARAEATEILEVQGLYVAPGFIDLHSHAGGGLESENLSVAHALVAQGITTAVINPDGGGSVDIAAQQEALLEHGLGVNVIQLVPHASIRQRAMGGSHDRAPTHEEMAEMLRLTREGMEAGAFGLSTGLFYTPGFYAETDEVIELMRIVAEYDGVHSSHIRDESDYSIGVVAAVQEIIDIARETGSAGIVSHVKALGPNVWGQSREIVERIDAARAEGVEVWADQYPYDASATGFVAALVPAWARDGGSGEMRDRMRDPELGERIHAGMAENLARRGGADRIMFRGSGGIAGRTLAELAEEAGADPVDHAFEMIAGGDSPGIISFNMHEDDIATLMQQPWTLTSTDGGLPTFGSGTPHPRTYGAFPRKLRKYVREEGVVDLAFAIRSMTGASAEAFRVRDRGVLRSGAWADVVVFDFERVHDPADFMEPHQYSEGMVHVFVNGVAVIRDGTFTNALPGRVLRLHETAPVVD